MKQYLKEKRDEIIWALSEQDYRRVDIAEMFNVSKMKITRIIEKKPDDYKSKWVKRQ